MKWVTLKRVKLDRTASAWLIRRFIDPQAEFEFVEKEDIDKAIEAGAKPFHNFVFTGKRREYSTFQQLAMDNGLDQTDPAIPLMGESLRAAEKSGLGQGRQRELRSLGHRQRGNCPGKRERRGNHRANAARV